MPQYRTVMENFYLLLLFSNVLQLRVLDLIKTYSVDNYFTIFFYDRKEFHSLNWDSGYQRLASPGQVQHSFQSVGAIFGTCFTEQRVVRLSGKNTHKIRHEGI